MHELPHELWNDLRLEQDLRKLGNLKKYLNYLGLMGSTEAVTYQPKFDIFDKKLQKDSFKTFLRKKPILLDFVSLSTTFYRKFSLKSLRQYAQKVL